MSSTNLVGRLRATADALAASRAEAERLRKRVYQLEAIARLNGETIRNMQRAAAEIERAQWFRRYGLDDGELGDDAGAGALRALEQVVSELDRMTEHATAPVPATCSTCSR
jgi:hypothetical protein